jgi:hypothetical protein
MGASSSASLRDLSGCSQEQSSPTTALFRLQEPQCVVVTLIMLNASAPTKQAVTVGEAPLHAPERFDVALDVNQDSPISRL